MVNGILKFIFGNKEELHYTWKITKLILGLNYIAFYFLKCIKYFTY